MLTREMLLDLDRLVGRGGVHASDPNAIVETGTGWGDLTASGVGFDVDDAGVEAITVAASEVAAAGLTAAELPHLRIVGGR